MGFLDMVMRLHIMFGMKIMLISCGSFYIDVGDDAVTLNNELGLKLNCAKRDLCKVGVPKNALNKYKEKLDKLGYGYVILDYNKEQNKIFKLFEKSGKDIDVSSFNKECDNCESKRLYRKTEYEKALIKFVKEEFGEDFIW